MSRDLEKKKARDKKYQLENKEKIREKQKAYYLKNKEALKKYRKEHYQENKDVYIERVREWAKNNKEARKNNILKSKYNITLDDYNKMFDEQTGCCFGCGKHQSEIEKPLCVDHCHETGLVRGLLCDKCNCALGFVNDRVDILENLTKYLKSFINDK